MSGRAADGRPVLVIHPTAFLAPGAVVTGDVGIGARASVWFHTVLRGDTDRIEIGEETNLQDLCVVHVDAGQPACIGDRVTVGHRAVVHGCTIEPGCLIGMGAIILSGARIGAGSLVAAGALVREGQVIPPASLVVGAPARVAGAVGETHRAAIARGAEHYVALARRYMARGFGRALPRAEDTLGRIPHDRGPMSELEWDRLLETLEDGPRRVHRLLAADAGQRWLAAPGPGRWSALEVVCHLRDSDREICLPRLCRLITEDLPELTGVDMAGWSLARGYRGEKPATALAAWQLAREELLGHLRPLGPPDWLRVALHPVRGSMSLGELVRGWVEHDLSHRRQISTALGQRL